MGVWPFGANLSGWKNGGPFAESDECALGYTSNGVRRSICGERAIVFRLLSGQTQFWPRLNKNVKKWFGGGISYLETGEGDAVIFSDGGRERGKRIESLSGTQSWLNSCYIAYS